MAPVWKLPTLETGFTVKLYKALDFLVSYRHSFGTKFGVIQTGDDKLTERTGAPTVNALLMGLSLGY